MMGAKYIVDNKQTIHMPRKFESDIFCELLSNYTYGREWNVIYDSDDNCITIGNSVKNELNGAEYVVNVTDYGVYIEGVDYPSAMRGFVTMLDKIRYDEKDEKFYIENCTEYGNPLIGFRCVHLCVFPETNIAFLKKCVRSCAIVKYSHIILEFWGMLKYDCMKELSWPFAFSKDEIKSVVREANALGVEIIPMFNHLGHASACRELGGKHVVLDQNPKYEYLFESYGWIWNIKRADVLELHSKIREELIEVCGEGKYFHIGCDEAYIIGNDTNKALETAKYLNDVAKELLNKGRRCIIWADMLLSSAEISGYEANSTLEVSNVFLNNLDKSILIADWQYSTHNEIWKTSEQIKKFGFDVVCCPFENNDNINEAINTAKKCDLFGIIHTTWNTLFVFFSGMINAGVLSYGGKTVGENDSGRFYCARVARMAMPSCGEYEKSGWAKRTTRTGV